jgi:tetratricopeptide (TPR) repeat protein
MKFVLPITALAVAAAVWLATTRSEAAAEGADSATILAVLRRLEGLDARIGRLESAGSAELAGAALAPREAAAAHVQHAPPTGHAAAARAASEAAGGPEPPAELAALVAELCAVGQWSEEGRALWHELAERGLLDQALALFEEHAGERPGDADAQADLGDAIAQTSHATTDAVEQIALARRADVAYDAALALDPQHWRARFHKAVSYTFWPDFLGKSPAAIEQFETLIAQQELTAAEPGFEKTYLYLGNLYAQAGDHAQALATWKAGLAVFPGDPALLAALGM